MYRTIEATNYEPQAIFGRADLSGECWEWRGSFYKNGYGKYGRKGIMAHRIAFELTKSRVPEEMCLDHLCKNRGCINPDHLEVVTLVENVLRGDSKNAKNARKTHCSKGHEFDSNNTYIHPQRGTRDCRICRRLSVSKYIEKKRG